MAVGENCGWGFGEGKHGVQDRAYALVPRCAVELFEVSENIHEALIWIQVMLNQRFPPSQLPGRVGETGIRTGGCGEVRPGVGPEKESGRQEKSLPTAVFVWGRRRLSR